MRRRVTKRNSPPMRGKCLKFMSKPINNDKPDNPLRRHVNLVDMAPPGVPGAIL